MGRHIEFEQMHNVRDLGGTVTRDGRTMREGLLFRGDQPYFMSDGDKSKMVALGIHKVIDLRSVGEHEEKPDPVIDGVENQYLPIFKDVRVGITQGKEGAKSIGKLLMSGESVDPSFVVEHMRNMYRTFVVDTFANAQYARLVDEVIASAEAGEGTLWHCTAGKDRAGFAAVILLEALGVAREDVKADYLLTNEYLRDFVAGFMPMIEERLASESAKEALMRFFMADLEFLEAAYEAAEKNYGSFETFLEQAIGVDESKRVKLRALFLE